MYLNKEKKAPAYDYREHNKIHLDAPTELWFPVSAGLPSVPPPATTDSLSSVMETPCTAFDTGRPDQREYRAYLHLVRFLSDGLFLFSNVLFQ